MKSARGSKSLKASQLKTSWNFQRMKCNRWHGIGLHRRRKLLRKIKRRSKIKPISIAWSRLLWIRGAWSAYRAFRVNLESILKIAIEYRANIYKLIKAGPKRPTKLVIKAEMPTGTTAPHLGPWSLGPSKFRKVFLLQSFDLLRLSNLPRLPRFAHPVLNCHTTPDKQVFGAR